MQSAITDISQLDPEAQYSYADYLTWQFEQTVELIKGKIFQMSPAPNVKHQKISSKLHICIGTYLQEKSCNLFAAPFDVRLLDKRKSSQANQDIYTVVQPDLSVICNAAQLDEQGCIGAPDLVVEILSPGNSKKEMRIKYALYEEAGVREYWVVFPSVRALVQFVLNEEEKFVFKSAFAEDEVFQAHIFPDLAIDLEEIFGE
ncbi:MAG TPA: restriction endonuclease [Microscillaceae bacterium]|jgi:Uma2 family endonuclease|nr:restriction endonuclease [Microscillaceae bacterium]